MAVVLGLEIASLIEDIERGSRERENRDKSRGVDSI